MHSIVRTARAVRRSRWSMLALSALLVCAGLAIGAAALGGTGPAPATAHGATPATLMKSKRRVVHHPRRVVHHRRRVVHHPRHGVGHWVPAANSPWQWVLDHPVSTSSASDMGLGFSTYAGGPAPAPRVFDIDGFDNSAATVRALHARGARVICYVSAGTWENWRPDASQFPGALRGSADPGWSGEQWLNIGPSPYLGTLEAIMYRRLAMCHAKGFDGVELDNMDVAENSSGFHISIAQDNAYVRWLANTAHALGLGVGQKNYFDQAPALVGTMDFMVSEQCFQYGNCDQLAPYTRAHKAVFEAEYADQGANPSGYCATSNALGLNTDEFMTNLDGSTRVTCR